MPDFTDEETLYISKKASEAVGLLDEVDIITPTPNITLKKGKTELNIGHAVTIIKKMEEKFPTGVNKDKAEEITRQVMAQEGEQEPITRNQFIKAANFPIEKVSPEMKRCVAKDEQEFQSEYKPSIRTVNANAYEIRADILSQALSWVQYTRQLGKPNDPIPTEDDVLSVAQKFYKFVENRK
jgi:hypothetical protein